jgi:uncharacterized membrane protein YeaQ/YmgE (transglycosylase-associated protein family)
MELLPWIFLALGAGLIARAIVPQAERATTWIEVILIGTAGTVFGAVFRQQIFARAGRPDGWALLFAVAGAVVFASIQRLAVRRSRTRRRIHPLSAGPHRVA